MAVERHTREIGGIQVKWAKGASVGHLRALWGYVLVLMGQRDPRGIPENLQGGSWSLFTQHDAE